MPRPPLRWIWFALATFALCSAASVSTRAQESKGYKLSVDVNLVTVTATVTDATAHPVSDLSKEDFAILEDGVPQEVTLFEPETHVPLALALMVDASLSTAKDLRFEKESAARFIAEMLEDRDRMAVYAFSDAVRSLADFTNSVDSLQRALHAITPESGTALYDAIVRGSRDVGRRPGRKVLILVTDGDDTTSENDFHAALAAAQRAEVLLYAVVIRPIRSEAGRNIRGEHALIQLAEGTGGRVFFPDRVEELDQIFPVINRELRAQYLLGYYPKPNPAASNFRRIEVRVKRANLFVRHRGGYYARGEENP